MHPAFAGVQLSVKSALWLSLHQHIGFWSYIFSFFPFLPPITNLPSLVDPHINTPLNSRLISFIERPAPSHLMQSVQILCLSLTLPASNSRMLTSACFQCFWQQWRGIDNCQQLRGLGEVPSPQWMDSNGCGVIHQENGLENEGMRDELLPETSDYLLNLYRGSFCGSNNVAISQARFLFYKNGYVLYNCFNVYVASSSSLLHLWASPFHSFAWKFDQ